MWRRRKKGGHNWDGMGFISCSVCGVVSVGCLASCLGAGGVLGTAEDVGRCRATEGRSREEGVDELGEWASGREMEDHLPGGVKAAMGVESGCLKADAHAQAHAAVASSASASASAAALRR